jgi:hypothetical protein
MSDHNVTDLAHEIQHWPSATLEELRATLFNTASGRVSDSFTNKPMMEAAINEVAAGHLIDAGTVSARQLSKQLMEEADDAFKAGSRRLPHPVTPIIFAATGGDSTAALFAVFKALSGTKPLLSMWEAKLSPDGEVHLIPIGGAAYGEERERQERIASWVALAMHYLLACAAAITPAVHRSGVPYSRLDVEKAIRLQAAGKPPQEPIDEGVRHLTLGDARRALTETPESDYAPLDHGFQSGGMQLVQDAAREAKEGRLFVVENLSTEIVSARAADAYAAVETGALRAPFPATFILATIGGVPGACLLGALDTGFVADQAQGYGFRFTAASPEWEDGRIIWSGLPPAATDARDKFQIYAVVILSLIADARSSVPRVAADDKLNKARIKRGKAAIPPYFLIEPPKPTVLVPNAAPTIEIAVKKKGTHASPRPHDRRGHPRHLSGDRTVWVRPCKINALLPHLTRGRSYYEIKLNGASP